MSPTLSHTRAPWVRKTSLSDSEVDRARGQAALGRAKTIGDYEAIRTARNQIDQAQREIEAHLAKEES